MKQLTGGDEREIDGLSPGQCLFSFQHNLIATTSCDHRHDLFPHVCRTKDRVKCLFRRVIGCLLSSVVDEAAGCLRWKFPT